MKAFINNNKFSLVFVVVLLFCGQCCWLYKLLLDANFFSALPIEVAAVFTSVGPGKVPAVGTFAYVYFFALPLIYAAVGSGAVSFTVAISLAYHIITGDSLPDSLMPQPEPEFIEPAVWWEGMALFISPFFLCLLATGLGAPWCAAELTGQVASTSLSLLFAKESYWIMLWVTGKTTPVVADSGPGVCPFLIDFLSANPGVALLAGSICLTALALLLVLLVLLADLCRNKQ